MADSFVKLPDDSGNTGKQVRTQTATIASQSVHTHYMILSDEAGTAIGVTGVPLKVDSSAITQPVSGTVAVSNFPATQPVSGTVTASAQPGVDIGDVTVNNASGASAVNVQDGGNSLTVDGSVSVSNFPATQPISGTVSVNTLPTGGNTIGAVNLAQYTPATGRLPVDPSGVTSPVSLAAGAQISIGSSSGKANVLKTGSLATTATTADQVVLTYTVTSGKTFYLTYFHVSARLTTFAATATLFGTASLETPSGTKGITLDLMGIGAPDDRVFTFPEPLPIAAGVVVRIVCTPSSTTGYTWKGCFGGYEK